MTRLRKYIEDFAGKKIAVVGDIVADQFLYGTIDRVSREAPVFILRHDKTETRPGGAGNAAANVASLGATPLLIGYAGTDENSNLLSGALAERGIGLDRIVFDASIKTTTKVRVLAGQHYAPRQQVIRIDHEHQGGIASEIRDKLVAMVEASLSQCDSVIVSDYGYGVIDDAMFTVIKKIAGERGIPLLVDSRYSLSKFTGATAATPNQDEVEQILGKGFSDADCVRLANDLEMKALLVTRGNEGMLMIANGKTLRLSAVGSKTPVDVTGAGDTVISVFALGIASGLDFADAAEVANHAGGIVVMKKGTATVTTSELIASIERENTTIISEAAS